MTHLTPIWSLFWLLLSIMVGSAVLILVLEAKERNKFSLRFWLRSKLGLNKNRKQPIKFLGISKTVKRVL